MNLFDVLFLFLYLACLLAGVIGSTARWGWWSGIICFIVAIAVYPVLFRGYVAVIFSILSRSRPSKTTRETN